MRSRGWLVASVATVSLLGCPAPGEDELAEGNRRAARGELAAAAESYAAATAKAPRTARAHELLGNARWALGQGDQAKAAWLEAVQLQPASVEAQLGLARLESSRGEHEAALGRVDKVLERSPARTDARTVHALALLARGSPGDPLKALADLDVALKTSPGDTEALYARTIAQLSLKRIDDARATCDTLDRLHPATELGAWANARLAAAQARRTDVILYLRQARAAAGTGWVPGRVRDDPAFVFMKDDADFSREF